MPTPTTGEAGIHCSITTDLLHLDGENIAALPLIERKESLRGLMAIEVPGLRFNEYVIGGGPRFREHTWRLGLEGSISKRIDRAWAPVIGASA